MESSLSGNSVVIIGMKNVIYLKYIFEKSQAAHENRAQILKNAIAGKRIREIGLWLDCGVLLTSPA